MCSRKWERERGEDERESVCSREWERESGRMRERERGERVCKKEREGRDDERVGEGGSERVGEGG